MYNPPPHKLRPVQIITEPPSVIHAHLAILCLEDNLGAQLCYPFAESLWRWVPADSQDEAGENGKGLGWFQDGFPTGTYSRRSLVSSSLYGETALALQLMAAPEGLGQGWPLSPTPAAEHRLCLNCGSSGLIKDLRRKFSVIF